MKDVWGILTVKILSMYTELGLKEETVDGIDKSKQVYKQLMEANYVGILSI